ncbi:hypothetical protein HU200_063662 [Digitaria exilis]|uniref:F-box protein n=1 Tax=Digitaria exilis TaxID=1010633 RepID=A0A835A108_9POAL|nr:hypothetical protein HU200_063662 [Digitaria exilis]
MARRHRSPRGVFINYCNQTNPFLFAPVDAAVGFMPDKDHQGMAVVDHCNGLVLCQDGITRHGNSRRLYVCNPATRRWQSSLPWSPWPRQGFGATYLAFDPAVSLHYEVFLLPPVPNIDKLGCKCRSIEWPPAVFKMDVFSSRSGCWEERQFLQEGDPVATPAHIYMVHDHNLEYMIPLADWLSLSDKKYRVVKTPTSFDSSDSEDERQANHNSNYNSDNEDEEGDAEDFEFLGFHPIEEVIFLGRKFRALEYHLGSTKAEYLGRFYPGQLMLHGRVTLGTFTYTPCFMDALPDD